MLSVGDHRYGQYPFDTRVRPTMKRSARIQTSEGQLQKSICAARSPSLREVDEDRAKDLPPKPLAELLQNRSVGTASRRDLQPRKDAIQWWWRDLDLAVSVVWNLINLQQSGTRSTIRSRHLGSVATRSQYDHDCGIFAAGGKSEGAHPTRRGGDLCA